MSFESEGYQFVQGGRLRRRSIPALGLKGNALFFIITAICVAIVTLLSLEYRTERDSSRGKPPYFLTFFGILFFGLLAYWLLSTAYHAIDVGQVDCWSRSGRCTIPVFFEDRDSLSFWLTAAFLYFGGVVLAASSVFCAIQMGSREA